MINFLRILGRIIINEVKIHDSEMGFLLDWILGIKKIKY